MSDVVEEWDAKFVDKSLEVLFDLVCAVNYMHIPSLLDLICAKIGSMLKGKTPEEIRAMGIGNTFTKPEEEQLREEAKWLRETTESSNTEQDENKSETQTTQQEEPQTSS
jgi:S-phase kinase-associated protein 1